MTGRILRYAHSATTVPCVGDNFDHLGWVFLCSDFATNYGYSCRQSEKFLLERLAFFWIRAFILS